MSARRASGPGALPVRLVPPAVALLGLVDLLSAVSRPQRARLSTLVEVVPLSVIHAAGAVTAAAGLVLVMLSSGLRRRKRRAWLATTAVIAGSVVLHVIKGLDVEEAVVSLVLLIVLVLNRNQFRAEGDPRSRWRAPLVGSALLFTSWLVGYALVVEASDRSVVGDRTAWRTALTVLHGLVGISGPLDLQGRRGDAIGDILVALGALTLITTVWLLLRSSRPISRLTPEDEEALRGLLSKHGHRDSLGYFALRRDKSVIFSPSGKAAIAYRVVGGCILASGDPVGDPEAWPGAIHEWIDLARRHGWVPAVLGASETGAQVWCRETGMDALELGDEAVVQVADHSLDGRAMRGVRQAVARVERAGYTAQVRRVGELDPDDRERLRSQAAAWRGAETERGFSMALGRLGAREDDSCVVVTAEQEGQLVAFLHFVPWGPDGLSLDLMRRDSSCENGINEFLIVSALRAAPALGVARVSLNFAVFRSALDRGQRIGAGPVLRFWTTLLLFASRWFQIESLHRFNAKFQPEWEPRFICYANARDLPRIVVAALEAEAFLVRPRWWPGHSMPMAGSPA